MKKCCILVILSLVLFSGCDTYTGSGAYIGSSIGGVLGSALGGIAGESRGSDIGTIVGMASGAIIGSAMGQAKAKQKQRDMAAYREDKYGRAAARARETRILESDGMTQMESDSIYDSGFDATNSGDDRLYDFDSTDGKSCCKVQGKRTYSPMHK